MAPERLAWAQHNAGTQLGVAQSPSGETDNENRSPAAAYTAVCQKVHERLNLFSELCGNSSWTWLVRAELRAGTQAEDPERERLTTTDNESNSHCQATVKFQGPSQSGTKRRGQRGVLSSCRVSCWNFNNNNSKWSLDSTELNLSKTNEHTFSMHNVRRYQSQD